MGVVQRLGCRLQGLGFRIYVRLRVGSLGLWVEFSPHAVAWKTWRIHGNHAGGS